MEILDLFLGLIESKTYLFPCQGDRKLLDGVKDGIDELRAKLLKYKIATGILGATTALLILRLIFHT